MEKQQFISGAVRENKNNKAYIHNLKGYTRLRFGYHMNLGSKAHGDSNWELGIPSNSYAEGLDRHWALYLDGDRSEDHLSAIIFAVQGIMLNERKDERIEADHYFKLKS